MINQLILMKECSQQNKCSLQLLYKNLAFKDQNLQVPHKLDTSISIQSEISLYSIILKCKIQLKAILSQNLLINSKLARRLFNSLSHLKKNNKQLLKEEILQLYMDLIQCQRNSQNDQLHQQQKQLIKRIIQSISGLVMQFFVFHQYLKMKNNNSQTNTQNKSKLLRKYSDLAQSQSKQLNQNKQNKQKKQQLQKIGKQLQKIRKQLSNITLSTLLSDYLTQYEININNLIQICKICQKQIKINNLQCHVAYCQQKSFCKQQLNIFYTQAQQMATKCLQKICIQQTQEQNYSEIIFLTQCQQIMKQIIKNNKKSSKSCTSIYSHSKTKSKSTYHKSKTFHNKIKEILSKLTEESQIYQCIYKLSDKYNKIQILQVKLKKLKEQSPSLKSIDSIESLQFTPIQSKKSRFTIKSQLQIQQVIGNCYIQGQQVIGNSYRSSKKQSSGKYVGEQSGQIFQIKLTKPEFKQRKQTRQKSVQFKIQSSSIESLCESKSQPQQQQKDSKKIKSMLMFDEIDDLNKIQEDKCQYSQGKSIQYSQGKSNENQDYNKKIDLSEFQILKFIGKGAYGNVYAVRRRNTEDLYALKMINIGENWGQKEFEQIKNQHQIFKKIAGEHLVQAPFCFSQGNVHLFIMEFMPGGDLAKVLAQQTYLQQQTAKQVLAQIVLAIEHLHNADIIHRDLKPDNLVIDQKGHLKLTDFGLSDIQMQGKLEKVVKKSNQVQQKQKLKKRGRRKAVFKRNNTVQLIGTPDYIAPQIINGISIDNKSIDWWSLGVMAYEILIGARPFCAMSIFEIIQNIQNFQIQWPQIGTQEGMITEEAYDFISKLLDKDFVNRLGSNSIDQIKDHAFFQGLDWDTIKQNKSLIAPNSNKIKQLLQMPEDLTLRAQIQVMTKVQKNIKIPKLDNFVRYDLLGEKTVQEANLVRVKSSKTLTRLRTVKSLIDEKENQIHDI